MNCSLFSNLSKNIYWGQVTLNNQDGGKNCIGTTRDIDKFRQYNEKIMQMMVWVYINDEYKREKNFLAEIGK